MKQWSVFGVPDSVYVLCEKNIILVVVQIVAPNMYKEIGTSVMHRFLSKWISRKRHKLKTESKIW